MSIVKEIGSLFKMMNSSWTSRVFTVIILLIGVYGYVKRGGKPEDCTYYREQNKELVRALIEIKASLQNMADAPPTVSAGAAINSLIFSAFTDTTRRPMSQMQQRQELQRLSNRIDTILYRIKQDSIKRKQ